MDRMVYVAMTGAKHVMNQQAQVAHNLANATTTGYRMQTSVFRVVPVIGEGAATRAFVVDSTPGADLTPGAVQQTDRDLDVAIVGRGWIAVQATDGSEAYTRNGNFRIGAGGVMETSTGHVVLGDGGPIAIPPDTLLTIAKDGTVSAVPSTGKPNAVTALGRIKLVDPPDAQLEKGRDGLFRLRGGGAAPADAMVVLAPGALEGSNVNVVDAMVSLIALARQFDMQMKLLQNADANARHAGQILSVR